MQNAKVFLGNDEIGKVKLNGSVISGNIDIPDLINNYFNYNQLRIKRGDKEWARTFFDSQGEFSFECPKFGSFLLSMDVIELEISLFAKRKFNIEGTQVRFGDQLIGVLSIDEQDFSVRLLANDHLSLNQEEELRFKFFSDSADEPVSIPPHHAGSEYVSPYFPHKEMQIESQEVFSLRVEWVD